MSAVVWIYAQPRKERLSVFNTECSSREVQRLVALRAINLGPFVVSEHVFTNRNTCYRRFHQQYCIFPCWPQVTACCSQPISEDPQNNRARDPPPPPPIFWNCLVMGCTIYVKVPPSFCYKVDEMPWEINSYLRPLAYSKTGFVI